jgi:uncharacterized membrane protein YhaH (DUF805 family)
MNYYLAVLKKYVDFNGRARRSEYWYFVLFNLIVSVLLLVVDSATKSPFLYTIYSLGVLLPNIAVAIRRMHDVNKSGWFCLIPIYNLILACTPGTIGTNEYGGDPKQPDMYEEIEQIGNN